MFVGTTNIFHKYLFSSTGFSVFMWLGLPNHFYVSDLSWSLNLEVSIFLRFFLIPDPETEILHGYY